MTRKPKVGAKSPQARGFDDDSLAGFWVDAGTASPNNTDATTRPKDMNGVKLGELAAALVEGGKEGKSFAEVGAIFNLTGPKMLDLSKWPSMKVAFEQWETHFTVFYERIIAGFARGDAGISEKQANAAERILRRYTKEWRNAAANRVDVPIDGRNDDLTPDEVNARLKQFLSRAQVNAKGKK